MGDESCVGCIIKGREKKIEGGRGNEEEGR